MRHIHNLFANLDDTSAITRRRLLAAGAGAVVGGGPEPSWADKKTAAPRLSVTESAAAEGAPLRAAEFAMVGVFDVDWLLEPRFTRVLDYFAASPGAFRAVRFFGALNSGEREDTFPRLPGGVWLQRDERPDFSTTLRALAALVSRDLVPFVALTFFPPAVSSSPTTPPADFGAWRTLVRGFLDAVVARFGAGEVARWWFEVWNEPNMPPFWRGSFDRYLELYRATSDTVEQSGHEVRLGGPALAYIPREGPALMARFLRFLARDPTVRCEFISYHRKGIWVDGEEAPRLERLAEAAEEVAQAVLRLVPQRARGLYIINDEADMKVGFDRPFEPRLTEHFPAWLAGSLIMHENLSAKHAEHGMRFVAAADNANQQLIQAPFDGRRSVMTRASLDTEDDLLKLPVYAFYELLPLLGDRRCPDTGQENPFVGTDVRHVATIGPAHIAVLFTSCPDQEGGPRWSFDYTLRNIPWRRANAVWFRVDGTHANAFAAVGRNMPAVLDEPEAVRRVRLAQELGVAAPIRSGLVLERGAFHDRLDLDPFATALLWITPFSPERPAAPSWVAAEVSGRNVVLRWSPMQEPAFYTYEVFRMGPGGRGRRVSPVPLRSAMWVDTAPPPGTYTYSVRAVTASGVASTVVSGPSIRL